MFMKIVQNRHLKKRIMIDSSSVLIDLCKFLSLFSLCYLSILKIIPIRVTLLGFTFSEMIFLTKAIKCSYLNQENPDVVPFTAQIQ